MSTASRKQREIREREAKILDVARPMLAQQGYHGLNMDRIAELLQYSKGTIYNHFSCKEEIIIALAVQTTEKRSELFRRAAAFRGRPRERMLAIGVGAELFVKLYPDHFQVEQVLRDASFWEKTSEKRRLTMHSCEQRCVSIVGGVVLDAVAQDDLKLPDEVQPEDLVFGLWSQSYGAHLIITTSESLADVGISEPFAALRYNISMMLDGFGWKPLSQMHDYDAVLRRIKNEVFPDEFRNANAG